MPCVAHHRRDATDQFADAHVLERQVAVIGHEFVDVGGESLFVDRLFAGPIEQHVDHRLAVAARDPGKQIDDLIAARKRQPAGHAEVDHRDAIARQVDHVARVRIGLEEAVLENHLEHAVDAALLRAA